MEAFKNIPGVEGKAGKDPGAEQNERGSGQRETGEMNSIQP